MQTVNIAKPCRYTRDDGSFIDLHKGPNDIDEEDAEHWFVKAHTVGYKPPEAKIGTHEYAVANRVKLKENYRDIAAEKLQAHHEAEAARKAKQADVMQATAIAISRKAEQAYDELNRDHDRANPDAPRRGRPPKVAA